LGISFPKLILMEACLPTIRGVKVIVYPHSMEIGGSQLNAVELGGAVRDLGHDVLVVSEPGPLVQTVERLGLEHVEIPMQRRRPSWPVLELLMDQVRRRGIDVVHGHEWPPALEAYLGPRLRQRVPAVATVMSAAVAPFLPRHMPLVVGTDQLRQEVLGDGYRDVTLIEPPVDTAANSPEFDPGDFRARFGFDADTLLVVVCCRLVRELKLEGLLTACDAIGALAAEGLPVQLAIVGDGEARAAVAGRAEEANRRAGRAAVVLTGSLSDPRPAYAAADVMLGMGGSALRGMAFGKPLVVQGEQAFWKTCTPETVDEFLTGGWYGLGDGGNGSGRLKQELEPLLKDAGRREKLGQFSRELVVTRFGLLSAAQVQLKVYGRAIDTLAAPNPGDLARMAGLLANYKVRRRIDRYRGRQAADDFNAISAMRAAR
jgi:glycosyltransferase involved in cell wall biosynthesis